MATNFPTSLDNLTNPAGSDPVNNPSHATQHANINDAIEVLEAKVGVNNSADTTSLDYRVRSLETNPTYTNEMAQDAVAAALAAGTHTNITINYNDTGNSISISAAAGYTNEEAVDAVAAALTAGSGISISYNDPANTITISVDSTIATKTYVDTAVSNLGSTAASTYVPVSEVGQADGIATLDATGQVPFSQLGNLVASAPATLDTLNELATALGNDANFATTTATSIGNKVSKAGGDVITSSLPGVIGLIVKGAASQTANLQEWQDSAGTVLGSIGAKGNISFASTITTAPNAEFVINGSNPYPAFLVRTAGGSWINYVGASGTTMYNSTLTVANLATQIPLTVKGAASQTADLQQWQSSDGSLQLRMTAYGKLFSNYLQASYGILTGNATYAGGYNFISNPSFATTDTSLIVKAVASQTGNLQEWQNSAGTVLTSINSAGNITSTNGTQYGKIGPAGFQSGGSSGIVDIHYNNGNLTIRGGSAFNSNTSLLISTGYAGGIGTIVKGAPSQTANLQEWQNSTGTILSKVDSTGAMFTITPADFTNSTQVATTAYVKNNIANLVSSAPATLDTLNELATALGNDANFSTTITNSLAAKAPLASPTFTGVPLAPTAASGTNTTQVATTAFVKTAIDSSVQPGALYQTSAPTSPAIGQIWIDADDDVTTFDSNIIRRKAFTATAGQTVFVTDLPFIDGFEQVYMNGLLLVKTTDYTVSGGNTVTLTSGAAVSDVIEVVTVTGANSVNTYTQAEVDALLAANTSVAPLSISANATLVAKKRYFVTSASALTLTLPASPALNDEIQIVDASGNASTYNITVARNGNKINGGTGNLIIDNNGGWYTLLYTGATYGWKVG